MKLYKPAGNYTRTSSHIKIKNLSEKLICFVSSTVEFTYDGKENTGYGRLFANTYQYDSKYFGIENDQCLQPNEDGFLLYSFYGVDNLSLVADMTLFVRMQHLEPEEEDSLKTLLSYENRKSETRNIINESEKPMVFSTGECLYENTMSRVIALQPSVGLARIVAVGENFSHTCSDLEGFEVVDFFGKPGRTLELK